MWARKESSEYLLIEDSSFYSLGKIERANCAGYETTLISADVVEIVNLQEHRKHHPSLSQPPKPVAQRKSRHKGKKYKKIDSDS